MFNDRCFTPISCFSDNKNGAIPIKLFTQGEFNNWLEEQPKFTKNWLASNKFEALANQVCLLPNEVGELELIISTKAEDSTDFWGYAHILECLPGGNYYIDAQNKDLIYKFSLNWALASYKFSAYLSNNTRMQKTLYLEQQSNDLAAIIQGVYLTRDLINIPSDDLGPAELARLSNSHAQRFGAQFRQWKGDELLASNFPAIYMVGRGSHREPRLLELTWGDPEHKQLTLVGKGVCFDSGGMDIKPSSAMRHMKKDMGGAAHVLGLAHMIMQEKLPIRLRVLIPAVENMVSSSAYRPGDVINTRKGITVEIENTDAEGRLVLADALCFASEENPDLLIDFATLTGAARIAVGTDIAALFTNSDTIDMELTKHAQQSQDPHWRLPLYKPYLSGLNSSIADILNSAGTAFAGATIAALFLEKFIEPNITWLHFDIMAWNNSSRPGRPEGGEALALRSVFSYLQHWCKQ